MAPVARLGHKDGKGRASHYITGGIVARLNYTMISFEQTQLVVLNLLDTIHVYLPVPLFHIIAFLKY